MVNILEPLAIDRGGMYVHFNTTELCSDTNTTLLITMDHFEDNKFWSDWIILNFATLIFLALFITRSYLANSEGVKTLIERAAEDTDTVAVLSRKLSWVFELIDHVKDWIYAVIFNHRLLSFMTILFSLTFPFALFDFSFIQNEPSF